MLNGTSRTDGHPKSSKVKKSFQKCCHRHRLCHLPSAECQSAKVCSKIHKISVRPSLPMFVYVAVCLFLFLWLFLSAKITDKRCWSKWKGDSASSPSPSPICMWVVLKCCARRLLYMALLSMSVSRHQCVCVICRQRQRQRERAQLITTYMGSHMHWEKIYINLHISKHILHIFSILKPVGLNLY